MLSEELCTKHEALHPMTPFNTHSNPGWGYYCPHCADGGPESKRGEWFEFLPL